MAFRNYRYCLFIFIFPFIFLFVMKAVTTRESNYGSIGSTIPRFKFADISDREYDLGAFSGKNIYIQFLDPSLETDLVLAENVWRTWHDYNLTMIIFPKNINSEITRLAAALDGFLVAKPINFLKIKRLLKSPSCCEQFYIYDLNHKLFAKGYSVIGYESTAKKYLQRLLENKSFNINVFIKKDKTVAEINWLHQISRLIDLNKKKIYVVGLFSNVCNNCLSGNLLKRLNALDRENQYVCVFSILKKSYSESDINNLKDNLKIGFPVYLADDKLDNKWNKLMHSFSETELNNIIIVADKDGRIDKILYEGCACYSSFMSYLDGLSASEKKNDINKEN
jgi:hypothetical protein